MAGGDWKEMYLSAEKGDLELLRYHVENGIDINYQHPEFLTTPLIASIEHQHIEVATYLLDQGADPKAKEIFGDHTPLSAAKATNNKELVKLVEGYL